MSYNRFVILYTSNFCSRINDFFCIDEWVRNGYDVEYWDLSAFTCHEHLADYKVKGLTIRVIKNVSEFSKLVKKYQNNKTLYLTWVNYCWYSAKFYRVLSKNNCEYAFFDNSLIPPISNRKIIKAIFSKRILNFIKNGFYKYILKNIDLKAAKYYFQLSESFIGIDKVNKSTIHGWCNSGDFENNRRLERMKDEKYIVFLDQYIPYHNDNILNGYKRVAPEKYFSSLNRCFDIIEKKYGVPIVIAAHPAATKYKENNPFNGRDLIYNQTSELVKSCEMVLAHFTTALSYVVLNDKNLILLTSDAIKEVRPEIDEFIIRLADLLGIRCVNQDYATENDFTIDELNIDKYNDYKYRYLTNRHSENYSNFENIIKVINTNKV